MVCSEYVMRQLISALYTIAENAEEFVGTQPLSGDLYITITLPADGGKAPAIQVRREHPVRVRQWTEE